MFTQEEQSFLEKFRQQLDYQEMAQAQELIQECNNKYQFAKTHSVYVKDHENFKENLHKKISLNQLETLPKHVALEMIKISDEVMKQKLILVQLAFMRKFGESIFNFLGSDGKTKKLFGIFG